MPTEPASASDVEAPAPASGSAPPPAWLSALVAWQAVLAAAGIVGGALILSGTLWGLGGLAQLLVGAAAIVAGLVCAIGVRDLQARRHRGRAIATIANYLVAFGFGFAALQNMGVFTGLDALGDNFRRWAWVLIVIGAGWVLVSQAERLGPAEQLVRRVGRWVALAGGVLLLFGVGLVPGVIEFFVRVVELDVIVPLVVGIAGGAAFWFLRRHEAGLLFKTTRDQAEALDGFLFASPNVLGFLAFFAGPLLFSLYVSFTSWDGLTDIEWIGLDNYVRIFSLQFTSVGDGQLAGDVLKDGYTELIRWGDFLIGARERLFWVGLRNKGLARLDPATDKFRIFKHDPAASDSLSNNQIYSLMEDSSGVIWIGTKRGLNRFQPGTQTFAHYMPEEDNPQSLSHQQISAIAEGPDGSIWLGT